MARKVLLIALCVMSTGMLLPALAQDSPVVKETSVRPDSTVTPVAGDSWLIHLDRPFGETSMGKTGHLGPPTFPAEQDLRNMRLRLLSIKDSPTIVLHGADLYRLNCQGCHTESGMGAPPEINSVINPVRATSAALVMQRMKNTGVDISPANATDMAKQSSVALLQRLHHGGENMPPFPHLNEAEIRAIVAYLRLLAGIPGAANQQIAVTESPVRVGEHIVKSTCHICHGATGTNPNSQQLLDGAIPPLETLTNRTSQAELVRKVTQGAPILMGTPALLCRGRMPVFYYLSEEEAADVYLYLTLYPPTQAADPDRTKAVTLIAATGPSGGDGRGGSPHSPPEPDPAPMPPEPAASNSGLKISLLLGAVFCLVAVALIGGLSFTMREFKRLSSQVRSADGEEERATTVRRAGVAGSEVAGLPRRVHGDSLKVT